MSDGEIKSKLLAHLERHWPLSEECHVVYVMVELRKVVERSRPDLRLLKFYADWTLHTSKERGHGAVADAVQALYSEASADLPPGGAPAFEAFIGMVRLKPEIGEILDFLGIKPGILLTEQNWQEFVRLLTDVLVDQPILDPLPNVSAIRFEAGHCIVEFTRPSGGDSIYKQPRPGPQTRVARPSPRLPGGT